MLPAPSYVTSGLNAAIAAEGLQQLNTQMVADLSLIPDVDLAPYAVMLLEIERVPGPSGCTSPSTVGDTRLTCASCKSRRATISSSCAARSR